MKIKFIILLSFIISLTSCFNEEATYTAYLEKDGTVALNAYVENVYSTEEDKEKRTLEEKKLLNNLIEETNIPLVKILEEKGAEKIKIILIHKTLPYAYVIKAEFDDFEEFLGLFTNENNNLSFDVDVNIGKKNGYIKISNSEFNVANGKKTENKKNLNKNDEEIRVFVSEAYNMKSDTLATSGENSFILNSSIFENGMITWDYEKKKKEEGKKQKAKL